MSVRCPSCGFESPEGSKWCDFCKEPFDKKATRPANAAPPDPLAGLTKEQVLELPAEQLLKSAEPPAPKPPPWLRPAAYAFFLAWLIGGTIVLTLAYFRYRAHVPR